MKSSPSETFITLYNELDAYMRKALRADRYVDHASLLREMSSKNRIFLNHLQDLRMFSEMRNMLVHNPYKKDADPLIHPHGYILKKYAEILNMVLNPPKALSIAVKRELIYTTSLAGNALEVMKTMNDKTYTHVPVIDQNKLVGVFSENTLISYLVHNKDSLIMKDTAIAEFKDFIGLNSHPSEYFEFVGRNALVSEVEDLFREGLRQHKRIAVVYITENGNKNEKLLGMLTAWDIAGKKS